ncbi:MAG: NUDIX domain-containing protein [Chloroflexi bacterium]|nr:NUDIX domain-containing protein [Chloroflexota bacterium]
MVPKWLEWAREIQALAQTSNMFAENDFQRQRYDRLEVIAAEIISEHTHLERQLLVDSFQAQVGYATPKLDVRSAIFRDNRLLLVRERVVDGWCMPGGWVDVGDVPSQAAVRETKEESGFDVQVTRLNGVYDTNRFEPLEVFHSYKLVFLAEIIGGEATTSNETSEVAFFGRKEIPENFAGSRTTTRQINDAYTALADPTLPTIFD